MELKTKNDDGIFNLNEQGKQELNWEGCKLVASNGKVISKDISPKYKDWSEPDYIKQIKRDSAIRYLEPMKAHEETTYLARNPIDPMEIAELKYDGHRGLVYLGKESNRSFSRNISKTSDWFTENTDQLPHVRDMDLSHLAGTVLDGEFDYGSTSNEVQSVTGSLPPRAIQYQFKHGFLPFFAFDILYFKGINIQQMPLWKRKIYLLIVLRDIWGKYTDDVFKFSTIYCNKKSVSSLMQLTSSYISPEFLEYLDEHIIIVQDFKSLFIETLDDNREGIIIKKLEGTYEQGKRSRNFLKIKGVSTWDCVMTGITKPTKEYTGKELQAWKYWESPEGRKTEFSKADGFDLVRKGYTPVTKPYFMGWCGGIEFSVWKDGKLVRVGDCKGLSEKAQQDLKENWKKYVAEQLVVEVKANGILDKKKGSLRHPRFKAFRKDKNSEDCTWEDHNREIWE